MQDVIKYIFITVLLSCLLSVIYVTISTDGNIDDIFGKEDQPKEFRTDNKNCSECHEGY